MELVLVLKIWEKELAISFEITKKLLKKMTFKWAQFYFRMEKKKEKKKNELAGKRLIYEIVVHGPINALCITSKSWFVHVPRRSVYRLQRCMNYSMCSPRGKARSDCHVVMCTGNLICIFDFFLYPEIIIRSSIYIYLYVLSKFNLI